MRATDFITELFKPGKKNWEWARLGRDEVSAFFKVGGRDYLWQAFTQSSNPTKWEIQFRLIRKPDTDPDELDLFGTTGTGNSAEVMSTAVDITRAFLKEYGLDRVEEITFNAKEDSRIGLYAKMIKRLLPNWDLYSKKDPVDGMIFSLTDRRAYDKPENKLSEEAKLIKTKGLYLKYAFNDHALLMKAFDSATKSPLAFVKFIKEKKELYPENLWVNDEYRNRGIAKTMYDTLKSEGYVINRSHDQTKAGSGFWDKHRGEDQYVWEQPEVIDEMPLPADWDPSQMRQQGTTFKSRLAYALERAKKLGTGSSRVATVIEYQGRPTVLKIAKNQKGLAQNSVEADILSDGYASQIGIMIPIIDYDEQNREPTWIHTEMATKANEKQLCHLMKCDSLELLVRFANTIAGKYRSVTSQMFIDGLVNNGKSEQDIETMTDYANKLADLANSFDVELADFSRPANWGIYKGQPVVVDVGFNSNVMNQYYRESEVEESGVSAGGASHKWMGNEPYRHLVEKDIDEDMTRRGFLGALGSAMATGAQAATGIKAPKGYNLLGNNPNNELALQKTAYGSGLKGPELAQFLGQMKHESWNFERLKEKPMGKDYFEKRYGVKHAPKTAKILGNKVPGDGQRYHGRGFVQLTGRDNYRMAGQALGIDLLNHPELAAKPDVAAKIAIWYWNTRVKPSVRNFADTTTVTKAINPAMRGLEDRHANFIDYMRII